MKGYKIDFAENTLTMNYTFAAAASIHGSEEYKLLKAIQQDFPGIQIITKSGRTQKKSHQFKRLTYENMEKHISVYENAKELEEVFQRVKTLSANAKSPYAYVRKWFEKQFPDYRAIPKSIERKPYAKIIVPSKQENEENKENKNDDAA